MRIFITALIALIGAAHVQAAPIVFSASGINPASIQGTVDAFRAALGTLNPNVAGSFGSGRREINWDGVPDALSAPNNLPPNFFNSTSPRGAEFATPGTAVQVSSTAASGVPVEFGNLNPTYSSIFQTFSPQRLFSAIGSNVVDVNFFVPGSSTLASVSGFGVIFTDVDIANLTSLTLFDLSNNSLGTFFAPALAGSESLSFLGVLFNAGERVSRVRLVSGNTPLSATATDGGAVDVVAMDDFIYGEPIARALPEPTTLLLLILPLVVLLRRTLR